MGQYTNPAHEISHHQRLRVDSWQRKSEDNKSFSESEKIVKKKCRLETAATVLFRVVLALTAVTQVPRQLPDNNHMSLILVRVHNNPCITNIIGGKPQKKII